MIPKGTTIPPTTTDINRQTHRHRHRRHRLLASSPAGIKLFVMFITSKPNYYVAHHLIDLSQPNSKILIFPSNFCYQIKDTYFPSNFATKSREEVSYT